MARDALVHLAEQTKDRTYYYISADGIESEYTFRTLSVKDVLKMESKIDVLTGVSRRGKKGRDKGRVDEIQALLDILKMVYVVSDEAKAAGFEFNDDMAWAFLKDAGLQGDGAMLGFYDSELWNNVLFHIRGKRMSEEDVAKVEEMVKELDSDDAGKKKQT